MMHIAKRKDMIRDGFLRKKLDAKNQGSFKKRKPRSTERFWSLYTDSNSSVGGFSLSSSLVATIYLPSGSRQSATRFSSTARLAWSFQVTIGWASAAGRPLLAWRVMALAFILPL